MTSEKRETAEVMIHDQRQWPNNICGGPIRYARASNYDGFALMDVEHGIPTFGSVSPTNPVTIRGQSVNVFNYPGQTEEIARQLVLRWNSHAVLLGALKLAEGRLAMLLPAILEGSDHPGATQYVLDKVRAALTHPQEAPSHG